MNQHQSPANTPLINSDVSSSFEVLFELPVAVVVVDRDTLLINFANYSFTRLVHRSSAELLNVAITEIYPALGDLLRSYIKNISNHHSQQQFDELKLATSEGTKWVNICCKPLYKHPTKLVLVPYDVTDHVETRKNLEHSQQERDELSNAMPQLVWIAKPDGTVIYYNDRVAEFAGAERMPDGSWSWGGMVHPEDLQATANAWKAAVATGGTYEIEHRVQLKDGNYRWLLSRAFPYRIDDKIVKWFGTATDIQAQKTHEEQLRYMAALTSNIADAVVGTDSAFRIITWNKGAEEMYGWKAEEALGKRARDLLKTEFTEDDNDWQEILYRTNSWKGEVIQYHKEGRVLHVLASVALIRDKNGDVVAGVGVNRGITPRKQQELDKLAAEQKVIESEKRYRNIFDSVPVSIFEEDMTAMIDALEKLSVEHSSGLRNHLLSHPQLPQQLMQLIKLRDANAASLKLFKASSKQELLDAGLQTFFTPEGYPTFVDKLMNFIADKQSYEGVQVLRTLTGEQIFALTTLTRPENNDFSSVLVSRYDISSTIEAQIALQQSEHRFRQAFQNAAIGMAITNPQAEFLQVNPAFEKITGFSEEELKGRPVSSINDPRDDERNRKEMQSLVAGEAPFLVTEKRYVHKDGSTVWVQVSVSVIRNEDGSVAHMIALAENVTESKKIREQLIESEQQFRVLANSISQLAWMAEGDGYLYWYNDRWYEYTGTTLDEMKGWGWEKVHHPDHIGWVKNFIATAWQTPEPWEVTFPLRRHDGVYRWFLTRAYPILDQEGKIIGWIGTNTDIDEQRTMAEKLEALVRERTAQLEQLNVVLEQKNLELERSNEDLQQFAHVASHDLKEPVRKVKTFTNRLLEEYADTIPSAARRYLEKVESAADRMYSMIDGVLLYSSVNAMQIQHEQVDLNKTISDIRLDLELLIDKKSATLNAAKLPVVSGSSVLLHQLFYNLLNNSLKFTKVDTPPVINISANEMEDYHEIIFSDNGIGFDQDDAEHLFKPFSRLNSKDSFEGTGLGLNLCKKIAERHGGFIEAQGKENESATFKIYLPKQPSPRNSSAGVPE